MSDINRLKHKAAANIAEAKKDKEERLIPIAETILSKYKNKYIDVIENDIEKAMTINFSHWSFGAYSEVSGDLLNLFKISEYDDIDFIYDIVLEDLVKHFKGKGFYFSEVYDTGLLTNWGFHIFWNRRTLIFSKIKSWLRISD